MLISNPLIFKYTYNSSPDLNVRFYIKSKEFDIKCVEDRNDNDDFEEKEAA